MDKTFKKPDGYKNVNSTQSNPINPQVNTWSSYFNIDYLCDLLKRITPYSSK